MRVIGPRKTFTLLVRVPGVVTADGQTITWTESTEFTGVITARKGPTSQQNYYHGKVGVEIDYVLRTSLMTITESDRIQLKGTDTIYDVVFVNDLFKKGKVLRVDLHERKY